MKKNYLIPEVCIVKVDGTSMIAQSIQRVQSSTGVGITYGGGNNGAARVKDATEAYDVWQDDWSAE